MPAGFFILLGAANGGLEKFTFKHIHGRNAPSFLCILCQQQPLWCLGPLLVAQIVAGVSAISSSLCRIISRSTVYLGTETAAVKQQGTHASWPSCPATRSPCGLPVLSLCYCYGPALRPLYHSIHFHSRMRRTKRRGQTRLFYYS